NFNRPVVKGFLKKTLVTKTFKQYLTEAASSIAYPFAADSQPAISDWVVLSETGYDNYDKLPTASGLTASLDATYTTGTYLYDTYNTAPEYAQNPQQSTLTLGMVTWTKTLVYTNASSLT